MKTIRKALCLVLVFSFSHVYSQTDLDQSQMKYWYYRDRLLKDFMLGTNGNFGESEPAAVRKNNYPQIECGTGNKIIKWSDGTIDLSFYIGVLATEYRLLLKYGQETDGTLRELFRAIEAFDRLDLYCETYQPGVLNSGASLNGFFIRDDIGPNVISAYNCASTSLTPLGTDYLTFLNHGDGTFPDVNRIVSTWANLHFENSTHASVTSKDQVIEMLIGLSLVLKCVPQGVSYQGMTFPDGATSLNDEAKAIVLRMVDHVHTASSSAFITNWDIKYTGTNYLAEPGTNFYSLAYGLSKAHFALTGFDNPTFWVTMLDPFWMIAKVSFLASAYAYPAWTFPSSNFRSEGYKFLAEMATSDCCLPASFLDTYSVFLYSDFPSEHFPLLRNYLYGGGLTIPKSYYDILFALAPCIGPHNYGPNYGGYQSYEWSSRSRCVHPDERGNPNPVTWNGEYNGLDYMLLYNLYRLNYNSFPGYTPYYTNMYKTNVHVDYPQLLSWGSFYHWYGNHQSPMAIHSMSVLNADNSISPDGDITFRAGEEINLDQGFTVDWGADFYAYIDDIDCANNIEFHREASGSQKPAAGGREDMLNPSTATISVHPVPFNSKLNIDFFIPSDGAVDISIYDPVGKKIETVFQNSRQVMGKFSFEYDGSGLKPGIYFCRLRTEREMKTIKIIRN